MINEAAILTLSLINGGIGLLLLTGKLRLVRTRPEPQPPMPLQLVAPIAVPKKKPGRPRKFKDNPRHIYLPPTVTEQQIDDVTELLLKNKKTGGDKVILHVSNNYGPERSIDIPFPVQWSPQVKDGLTTILDGWV